MNLSKHKKSMRHNKDLESIKNLHSLLIDISLHPSKWMNNVEIKLALSSQGSMSKFENADLLIHKMSLNHQKKLAIELFGSYELLDHKRRSAIDSLLTINTRKSIGSPNSIRALKARVVELESELSSALQDLFLLQMSYDIRCQQARSYVKNSDEATRVRCIKEQNELDVMSSLRKVHFDQTNVKAINLKSTYD